MKTFAEHVEVLVDTHGVDGLLDTLSRVCGEKAAHVREAWQDEGLARLWEKAEREVERARVRVAQACPPPLKL